MATLNSRAAAEASITKGADEGLFIHDLMTRLWPICRSITGDGVRQTLDIIGEHLPGLQIREVPTGTRCFDWSVPREWSIREAWIEAPGGERVVDFARNNLHIVSYSTPVDAVLSLEELDTRLHSIPEQPEAIPYVTSYYRDYWGFCVSHEVRRNLRPGNYRVRIDSEMKHGSLTYGELVVPGSSPREILFSTYVCHPSLANNELSGPCLATALAAYVRRLERRFTYRFVFIPETIGAIYYISENLDRLKAQVAAGFVLTCVGDERAWSFMPSRAGDTWADRIARHVLSHAAPEHRTYRFLDRGSDERQYCSPGVDLPVCSVMRSKYATYPEYHTSLDDLTFVTPEGLQGSYDLHCRMIDVIEADCVPSYRVLCEPKMSDRGLRPTIGKRGSADGGRAMMDLLAYADGRTPLLHIAEIIGVPAWELRELVDQLVRLDLLELDSE
jgi:aminopeptidase-like protein